MFFVIWWVYAKLHSGHLSKSYCHHRPPLLWPLVHCSTVGFTILNCSITKYPVLLCIVLCNYHGRIVWHYMSLTTASRDKWGGLWIINSIISHHVKRAVLYSIVSSTKDDRSDTMNSNHPTSGCKQTYSDIYMPIVYIPHHPMQSISMFFGDCLHPECRQWHNTALAHGAVDWDDQYGSPTPFWLHRLIMITKNPSSLSKPSYSAFRPNKRTFRDISPLMVTLCLKGWASEILLVKSSNSQK